MLRGTVAIGRAMPPSTPRLPPHGLPPPGAVCAPGRPRARRCPFRELTAAMSRLALVFLLFPVCPNARLQLRQAGIQARHAVTSAPHGGRRGGGRRPRDVAISSSAAAAAPEQTVAELSTRPQNVAVLQMHWYVACAAPDPPPALCLAARFERTHDQCEKEHAPARPPPASLPPQLT